MIHKLSREEKKVAKAVIDKGLAASYTAGLKEFETILKQWRKGKFETDRDAYHQLYSAVEIVDNTIGERFEGVKGEKYLLTVAAILADGHIGLEDLEGFTDETIKEIKSVAEVMGGFSY